MLYAVYSDPDAPPRPKSSMLQLTYFCKFFLEFFIGLLCPAKFLWGFKQSGQTLIACNSVVSGDMVAKSQGWCHWMCMCDLEILLKSASMMFDKLHCR